MPRQSRRLSVFKPGQKRAVRHALEDAPEPVFLSPEPQPLLQRIGSLLEDDDPQSVLAPA